MSVKPSVTDGNYGFDGLWDSCNNALADSEAHPDNQIRILAEWFYVAGMMRILEHRTEWERKQKVKK